MLKKLLVVLPAITLFATSAIAAPTLPAALCKQSGRFHPCVCSDDAPSSFQYIPSSDLCGGKAAIVLSGNLRHSFSVVVRDGENRDRWPTPFGINRCSKYQTTVQGLNKCSAFKVQKKVRSPDGGIVNCLGASGDSPLLKGIIRATIKLHVNGPIYYQCLAPKHAPTTAINVTPTAVPTVIPTETPTATPTATTTPTPMSMAN